MDRHGGVTDKLWSRRYQAILISDEEAAHVERLKYVLANGCKENLVASPLEWPGVHCARALLLGEPLEGTWHNRTLAYNFRMRGKSSDPSQVETRVTVQLSQLPCWKHLAPEVYRSRLAGLVQEIEKTAAAEREKKGVEPLGAEQVQAQEAETRPETLDKSPAPFIHAATKKARKAIHEAYAWFVAAYREPQTNSGREIETPPSRPVAFRRICRSCRPEPRTSVTVSKKRNTLSLPDMGRSEAEVYSFKRSNPRLEASLAHRSAAKVSETAGAGICDRKLGRRPAAWAGELHRLLEGRLESISLGVGATE
ncbi:MAG TPA: hypothetical protein VKM72_28715 [Thermoanaerobaculia bacterium]|nr:hypothetical protein [Thermoanaerobaculia bacterium]